MVHVRVEVLLPEGGQYGSELELGDVDLSIDDLEPTTSGTVSVRHSRQGAVVALEGETSDPHRLARDSRVVSVWPEGQPLWDSPVDEDDPSRYAL